MFQRLDNSVGNTEGPLLGKFLNSIDTPAPVLRTFIGNPLLTAPDAIDEVKEAYLGQLDVADLIFKDFGNMPLSKLYTPFPQVQWLMSARQSGKHSESNCDAGGMNIDTHCGRKQLTVPLYVARVAVDKPKIVIALADEINATLGKKRLTKAIERTATWFQSFVTSSSAAGVNFADTSQSCFGAQERPFLFGVAQYDPSYPVQLPLLVKHMLSQGAQGMVIGNAHLGETDAQRTESVKAIRALLTPQVPTLIQGADTLHEILLSLSLGIDLVSTNYPQALCALGHALAIDPTLLEVDDTCSAAGAGASASAADNSDSDLGAGAKRRLNESTSNATSKRSRTDAGEGDSTSTTSAAIADTTHTSADISNNSSSCNGNSLQGQGQSSHGGTLPAAQCEMNLWDVKYRRDKRPLVEGCTCHACRHHSRAYIHHLHICKEILAEVLLYHHNVHQVLLLFRAARHHIARGSFDSWLQRLHAAM